ncbi:MAG: transaldolase [Chloroflexi bacterium]|nr:transaldolase [Chloroflexota bacterium]
MRWYIDSAHVNTWQEWMPTGLFYGITTNPLLLERALLPCTHEQLASVVKIGFELGAQEMHIQTWGETAAAMANNAERIAGLDPRVVVKVPITREGATCASWLTARGVKTTMTALYAAHQVGTAMALGATYAAPYLGRMDEIGRDGHATVRTMQRMIQAVGSPMRLLVASVRHVSDIAALLQEGVDTFTLAPLLLPHLFSDPATTVAAADFERAAASQQPAS